MNIGQSIDELYELRSMRLDFEKQVESMKQHEKALEAALVTALADTGISLARGTRASFSTTKDTVPNVDSWTDLYEFIKTEDDFTLLQKRIGVTAWREYYTQSNLIVPGTSAFETTKANLRKI